MRCQLEMMRRDFIYILVIIRDVLHRCLVNLEFTLSVETSISTDSPGIADELSVRVGWYAR